MFTVILQPFDTLLLGFGVRILQSESVVMEVPYRRPSMQKLIKK